MNPVLPTIDEIPLPANTPGRLFATGFSAVGPNPDAALNRVGGECMVWLLTAHEIHLRFPSYDAWLNENTGDHGRALWLPTDDGDIAPDDQLAGLVEQVAERLREGRTVLTHCGAGLARTAVVGILSMIALGADPNSAGPDFRKARPGGSPDGITQASQIERLRERFTLP